MSDPGMRLLLDPLHRSYGSGSPSLHRIKRSQRHRSTLQQRLCHSVDQGDCILDREVDPDPADRRHGMGGVADANQTVAIPAG